MSNRKPNRKPQTQPIANRKPEVCDLVGVLQTTVDTLQAQLAVKDEQIRELNARLAECSTALLAAQELRVRRRPSTLGQCSSSLPVGKIVHLPTCRRIGQRRKDGAG